MFYVEHGAGAEFFPTHRVPTYILFRVEQRRLCRRLSLTAVTSSDQTQRNPVDHPNIQHVPRGTSVRNAEPDFTPHFAQNSLLQSSSLLQLKFGSR